MQNEPKQQRQAIGCGFEPALGGPIAPWTGLGYSGPKPTVCPGYSCNLPEVIETARARVHWSKGALESFAGGPPTDEMIGAIEVLDGAYNELDVWRFENPQKKGL